jgi:hypothetical protein
MAQEKFFHVTDSMNQNTQGNKEQTIFQRQEEKKSIRNHKRGDRTVEQHRETERQVTRRKVGNSTHLQPQLQGGVGETEQ